MSESSIGKGHRRILWTNVITVISAAILIGTEVFGAAYAGGWAIAGVLGFGDYGVYLLQATLFAIGIAVMVAFVGVAARVEPFTTKRRPLTREDGAV
jgi:uncharacterized membrane protein